MIAGKAVHLKPYTACVPGGRKQIGGVIEHPVRQIAYLCSLKILAAHRTVELRQVRGDKPGDGMAITPFSRGQGEPGFSGSLLTALFRLHHRGESFAPLFNLRFYSLLEPGVSLLEGLLHDYNLPLAYDQPLKFRDFKPCCGL